MNIRLLIVIIIGLSSLWTQALFAMNTNSEETSAAFLKIGIGARATAMGGAYSAIADDPSALYWNPAGLVQIRENQLVAMHTEWLSEINYAWIAFAHPLSHATIASSINYLVTDKINVTTSVDKTGTGETFISSDALFSLGYGELINDYFSVGIVGKYFQEQIQDTYAGAIAVDMGTLFFLTKGIRLSLGIQNLGSNLKFIEEEFPLPRNYKIGLSYSDKSHFTADMETSFFEVDNKLKLRCGIEFIPIKLIALRCGYMWDSITNQLGDFNGAPSGLSTGVGINLMDTCSLDYAYVPYGILEDTHRIEIRILWGNKVGISPAFKGTDTSKHKPAAGKKHPIEDFITKEIPSSPEDIFILKENPITEKPKRTLIVIEDNCIIWSQPKAKSDVVAIVNKGDKLFLFDDSKSWYYKVKLEDGRVGWVCYVFVK